MRQCAKKVEVRVDGAGRPRAFRHRGQFYRVIQHVEQWQARTAWWLQNVAVTELSLEEAMWRVEASCGPRIGVFDLRQSSQGWMLVGILD